MEALEVGRVELPIIIPSKPGFIVLLKRDINF